MSHGPGEKKSFDRFSGSRSGTHWGFVNVMVAPDTGRRFLFYLDLIYSDYDNVTRMCYIEFSKICGVAILFKSPSGFALGTIAMLISFQIFRKLEDGERRVSVRFDSKSN